MNRRRQPGITPARKKVTSLKRQRRPFAGASGLSVSIFPAGVIWHYVPMYCYSTVGQVCVPRLERGHGRKSPALYLLAVSRQLTAANPLNIFKIHVQFFFD